MRYVPITVSILATTLFSLCSLAAEPTPISLTVPPTLAEEVCRSPVWNGTAVVWGGVVDRRPSPEVGLQTQQGKEALPVVSSPPLAEVFDRALRGLFAACGMKLLGGGTENAPELSAEIRVFSVGVEKKLLTGKSEAKSSIAFLSRRGNRSSSVTVGFEIDSKKIRSGNTKQLEKTLNDLLTETLRQIPATPEMRELGAQP